MLHKKPSPTEKAIDKIQLGKMAEALWPEFAPILRNRRDQAMATLKHLYGEKKSDCALYIAEVAIITCLDDIISTVERSIQTSRRKEMEIIDASRSPAGPN